MSFLQLAVDESGSGSHPSLVQAEVGQVEGVGERRLPRRMAAWYAVCEAMRKPAACDGAASSIMPTPSCPDTYGRPTGTGYVPRHIVTSGRARAAISMRMMTQSSKGSSPGAARDPPTETHAQAGQGGPGGLGYLIER
jgi:hypothetical protein